MSGDEDPATHGYDVVSSEPVYVGRVTTMRRDVVRMPDGSTSQRDVVEHPGAVAVVALADDGKVMLVRQYRHPVRASLWELPAGLLDVEGERAVDAAARELAEEAHLVAQRWHVLADMLTSAGMTDEAVRVFLARDLAQLPPHEVVPGEMEEAEMVREWVDLDEAVRRVFAGEIQNAACIVGLLAAASARGDGFTSLRSGSVDWPARPHA